MSLVDDHLLYGTDIDKRPFLRTVDGKSLKDIFDLVNSPGFLVGETYDGFLCEENPVNGFKTFHFFFQGEEVFSIILGFNSSNDIGALKTEPSENITNLFFVQGLNLGLEPVGSIMGALFVIGGNNIVFTLLTDAGGIFELQNNNQLVSTIPIPEGQYKIFVKAAGTGGTQYIDEITIDIFATALISNINLSNLTIEDGSVIGTAVGSLSTNGGEAPITYSIEAQVDSNEDPVDLFEISGIVLQSKALLGVAGTSYRVFIKAEDSRLELSDDQRIKIEEFDILVVASTFLNSNSLSFNGVDERITIPHNISLWGGSKFSASAWIKPNNIGSGQYFLSKFQEAGKRSWAMRVNASGTIAVIFSQTGVASDTTTAPTAITFSNWHHIAFAFDGTLAQPKMKIWINGILDVDEDTALTTLNNNTTVDMFIGALNQPLPTVASSYYSGFVDEVSIYNDALTTVQVQEIYNLGEPTNIKALLSAPALISWWRMGDDFSGGIQPDFEGSNDGTGVNMNNGNKSTDVPL